MDFGCDGSTTVGAASEARTPASPDSRETRGRRRDRDEDGDTGVGEGDGHGSSRKRSRSKKGLDKKYECAHEGCGKSYSRAEHLYRHQLNHNPKQIYHCDLPDCHRSFVRQDLCARHKKRHTARGSQLLRKNTLNKHNLNPIVTTALGGKNVLPSKPYAIKTQGSCGRQSPSSGASNTGPGNRVSPPNFQRPGSTTTHSRQEPLQRSGSDDTYRSGSEVKPHDMQSQSSRSFAPPPRPATLGNYGGGRTSLHNSPHVGNENFTRPHLRAQTSNISSCGWSSSFNSAVTPSQYTSPASSTGYQNSASAYQSQQNFSLLSSLPPPEYSQPAGTPVSREQENQFYNGTSGQTPINGVESTGQIDNRMQDVSDAIMEQNTAYAVPMFGGAGYSRSPFAMADDFAAWLFNNNQFHSRSASPMDYSGGVNPVADTSS